MSQASTPCAAARPSAMAQTMSDWPRPASPATKTPGTEVMKCVVARDVRALVELDAELLDAARLLRAEEAHREQHQLRRDLPLAALDLLEAALAHLDLVQPQRAHAARARRRGTRSVRHGVDAVAALLVRRGDAVGHRVGRPGLARRPAPRRAAA